MSDNDGKIECAICKGRDHAMQLHLRDAHPEVTLKEYQERFPGSPIMSALAREKLEAKKAALAKHEATTEVAMVASAGGATVTELIQPGSLIKKPMAEVFDLGKSKATMSPSGQPIMIDVVHNADQTYAPIPDVDENYVFDIEIVKNVNMGMKMRVPTYLWGHTGTGKTTMLEQVCARTGRPFMRIQHTINTEESHITGQWTVRDGHTVFELGPLAVAMKYGLVYCADEYDFAMPQVLSVYQAVLEGKSLVIKEADAANRVVRPHPNFQFVATGNTNGCGDESGLYQGTNVQNFANYGRFGIVMEVGYMKPALEAKVIQGQANVPESSAVKLVEFAGYVREARASNRMSATIGPRELIRAAQIGTWRASFSLGLELAFVNKLSKVDREVAKSLVQRVFDRT